MSIIITEEDLCKKHAKKCAKIYQFSSLPSKWIQAVNDPNTKNDCKPHICAYNYNTRTGFRDHKKIWGPRVLSSALLSRSFPQGDIISWDREPWDMRSPWNRSEAEMLDLERDVCANQDRGYFMVPQKLSFDESKHVCKKLSGSPLSYTSKADLEAVVHFVSGSSNMRASACIEALEDGSTSVQVWGGGMAGEDRVNWTTWDTNQYIEVM